MKWLHISDLHYNPNKDSFDTDLLLRKLCEYLDDQQQPVDEIFYTGDFRFARDQKTTEDNARLASAKLMEIAGKAGVTDPKHIHIVPGNHDLDRGDVALLEQAYALYENGSFSGSLTCDGAPLPCIDYLVGRFQFFSMVATELNNQVWTDSPADELRRHHRSGKINNLYNILYLNTALGCGQDGERTKLHAGYQYIAQAFRTLDNRLPTIVLGHHGLSCFTRKEGERIKELFKQYNVRLFLCGDEHVGGFDEFDSTLQLTAGCLNQEERGIEPTFYIGDMDEAGVFNVESYSYQNGAYPGWYENQPLSKRIQTWTRKAFLSSSPTVFGRDEIIERISDFLKAPQGKIAEVWGVAGVGKTTVCTEVLKRLNKAQIIVNTTLNSTAIDIQRDILRQLGVDVDQSNIPPDEYASILLNEARKVKIILYLDNAESPILKDRTAFADWLLSFAHDSGWRVLYSAQTQLYAESIEPFPLLPLLEDDAYDLFVSRRWNLKSLNVRSNEEKNLAREIAVTLLSRHPLAIVLATSSRHNKLPLTEIRDSLWKRMDFTLGDDRDNPHRSMLVALSLTLSGISNSNVAQQARELWSLLAQYPGEFSSELFTLAYNNKAEYNEARLVLREYALLGEQDYTMLEPIKAAAFSFFQEERKTSRSLLFQTFATIFTMKKGSQSQDMAIWHDLSLACIQPALLLLNESEYNDFDITHSVITSVLHYFRFSSYMALTILRKLESLYRTERANLGLANVLKAMGDLESCLESRLGDIDAAQTHYADAEQLYRTERANLGLANVLLAMGDLESRLGELDAAQTHYVDAEQLYRTERHNLGLANVLLAMGVLESRLGELDAAISKYSIALELYESERTPMKQVYCMAELCRAYAIKKDEPNFLKYAEATTEALGSVSKNVADYALACVHEAKSIMGFISSDIDEPQSTE